MSWSIKRLLIPSSAIAAVGMAYWHYRKTSFYDPETKDILRSALLNEQKGNFKEAEDYYHRALASCQSKFGPKSVRSICIQMA